MFPAFQFRRPDFMATVAGALERIALRPFLLELELTETVIMQGVDDVKRLADLRSMGVTISIDDFGTGYSSLSYVQRLPIDSLKIDQSFIRNLPFDANALSLMQPLISLVHSLGMTVIAEGVETRSQLDAIRALGCDMAQGYFIGRPVPTSRLPAIELRESGLL
jgi:diguanylate cyclase